MNYKLILNIAFHLLRARLKQTIVAAVGVTFSIAMFISLVSFMSGLNDLLDGLMLNRTPHIRMFNEVKPSENQPLSMSKDYKKNTVFIHSIKPKDRGRSIYNSMSIISTLKQDKRVIDVAPKVTASVLFNSGTIEISGFVNGIDVVAENTLFKISDYIKEGKLSDLNQNNSIIIGKGLSDKMLLSKGDIIKVSTSNGNLASLKIVGISETGIADIDNMSSYTALTTAQTLLGQPKNYITDIQVNLYNKEEAVAMAKEFHSTFNLDTTDYLAANVQFETGSTVRSIISYAVGIVLLIVAGFGIYNILNMMIYEKMDSIAILKATGFKGSDVVKIFVLEAVVMGFIGTVMGLLVGSGLIFVMSHVYMGGPVGYFPIGFELDIFIRSGVLGLFITFCAGYFPARKAAKIDPVEIFRK